MLDDSIVLMAMRDQNNDKAIAHKLHQQFGHPRAEKLIKLVTDAGFNNKKLIKEIKLISKTCIICMKHKRPNPRPIVCLPLASRFNEMVGIDLKKWNESYFLVIVDIATRYCQAYVLVNKLPRTIIKALFVSWISIFGAPQKIISDNGGEFCNNEIRELSNIFCIKLLTTAAESPWSNGICERLNGVLGEIVSKIVEDTASGVQIALAWAVAARNTFVNRSGVSPNQLVFGFNPHFPNIYDSNLPASSLEEPSTDIIRKNSEARNKAREIFIRYEANERIRKALRHNVRHTDIDTIQHGDEVLYKRRENNKWQGPGRVTDIDLRAKTVTINHGGYLIKAHAVSILKVPNLIEEQQNVDNTDIDEILCEEQNTNSKVTKKIDTNLEQDNSRQSLEMIDVDTIQTSKTNNLETKNSIPNSKNITNDSIDITNMERGQRFKGIEKQTGKYISGKILNKAAKMKGSDKHRYNVLQNNGKIGWIHMENIKDLQLIPKESHMIIFFNSAEVDRAKQLEIEKWIANEVFEEVEDIGQLTISVRWVITEKPIEDDFVTRARLVARGFEEETKHLKKDSPTCSRETVKIVFWIASWKQWSCQTVDVKAAYLQGDDIEREVYLKPPKEFDIGKLWKLKKTVYGLKDAARAWYLKVKDVLTDLGVEKCTLDNSLFFWHENGILEGIICLYVDDFLYAGTEKFVTKIIQKFMKKFQIGSIGNVNFTYVGLRINSYNDGITVDQDHYIESINAIHISKARILEKNCELTKKEHANFRTLVGQLSWISTHTRPDIAFETCELGSASKSATITDLIKLNKLVERIKSKSVNLYFPKTGTPKNCIIKCFTDASFRNLAQEGSQAGFIIFIDHEEEQKRCPIHWQSKKIDRVVDSTLAAETHALHEGAKFSIYLASLIQQLLPNIVTKVICITDNKSLVDALHSTKMMKDRWFRLSILGISGMLEKGEIDRVEWIESKNQLADTLTKRGPCRDKLIHSISRT